MEPRDTRAWNEADRRRAAGDEGGDGNGSGGGGKDEGAD